MDQPGLRERSKTRRREAIVAAGMRLFAEHGYDGTTLAAIADAAEVAPRTVSLYFPTKLDIALSHTNEGCERLADALDGRLAGESVISVLEGFLTAEAEHDDAERQRLVAGMLAANPSLPALRTPSVERVFASARTALSADLQLPADDFSIHLAVTTLVGVLAVYGSPTARTDEGFDRMQAALTFLSAAFDAIRS